ERVTARTSRCGRGVSSLPWGTMLALPWVVTDDTESDTRGSHFRKTESTTCWNRNFDLSVRHSLDFRLCGTNRNFQSLGKRRGFRTTNTRLVRRRLALICWLL